MAPIFWSLYTTLNSVLSIIATSAHLRCHEQNLLMQKTIIVGGIV